jgi:predicted hydrocarbon binding protein
MAEQTLEKRLVAAGLDALREIGGEALVQVLLTQAGTPDIAAGSVTERVPLADYLRYRDTAIDFLRESFCGTAFETGKLLARSLRRDNEAQLRALLTTYGNTASKLPLIGQAAVLGARNNPGVVRAAMRDENLLVITIEDCPECRGLKRDAPFCFLNQGLITELAEGDLGLKVRTEETKCIAMGDRQCEIQVTERP